MNENFLVNEYFDDAVAKYIELSKNGNLENCDEFLLKVIKCLVFIYGDLDLINPHITKDTKALVENISKYGYPKNDIIKFVDLISNRNNYIDEIVANQLVDMFYLKTKVLNVSENEKNTFLHILCNLVESQKVYNYFENKFNDNLVEKEIEFLEIEPDLTEKEDRKKLSFQFGAASGYASIMTILITIALVCVVITVLNFLAG